jgi:hypothetical protein
MHYIFVWQVPHIYERFHISLAGSPQLWQVSFTIIISGRFSSTLSGSYLILTVPGEPANFLLNLPE